MTDLRQVLLADPAAFILHYFPHRIQKLEDFHIRLIETAVKWPRSLTLYPAGHGKTTLISTLLPIWAVCNDPNIRIAIIAKNEDEAKNKIARVIIAEFMGNEELINDFGPFYPGEDSNKSWSLTNLTVANRTAKMKEPTLAFFGSGSKGTLGHRTDWTICDDVVTEKNSATAVQRESMKDWFDLSVETMPEFEHSRLTVVGTLFEPEDLYHDIIELLYPDTGEPIYVVNREDAVVDEEEHKTLWPERWPWKRLMAQKAKTGTLNFNKRYRNIAVDKSRMVFKEAYIKGGYESGEKYDGCLDRKYSFGRYEEDWTRAGGFDPAIGSYRGHKFCAHLTLGMGHCVEHERCLWVIDCERDQMSLPQQAEMILSQHAEYDLFVSRVEANSYQQGLMDDLKRRMDEAGLAYRIEPHFTNRVNKPDPELGVQSMAPWFENGWVHIPWADQASRRKMGPLVEELVMYPGRTTDTVMAFWFAWRALNEGVSKFKSFNRLREPTSTFYGKRLSRWEVRNPVYDRD
jgi:hypothetical protein